MVSGFWSLATGFWQNNFDKLQEASSQKRF
jgi:hypothetical protein